MNTGVTNVSHLPGQSWWPILITLTLGGSVCYLFLWFSGMSWDYTYLLLVPISCVWCLWLKDVVIESLSGQHTVHTQSGLRLSFLLFVFSEIIFFISVFWLFLDSSLSPSIELGGLWPAIGLVTPSPLGIPLLGTVVLLSSGVAVSWSHAHILSGASVNESLGAGILLGTCFLLLQELEYITSSFTLSDSVYGSSFYFGTGFHGIHVFGGTIFLLGCFFLNSQGCYTAMSHVGFECSLIYWHFVDVVWLFLYLVFYCWSV